MKKDSKRIAQAGVQEAAGAAEHPSESQGEAAGGAASKAAGELNMDVFYIRI